MCGLNTSEGDAVVCPRPLEYQEAVAGARVGCMLRLQLDCSAPYGDITNALFRDAFFENQQANGLDTGWMLPPEHQDLCEGFRQSSFDSSVFFAVSEVQSFWLNPRAVLLYSPQRCTIIRWTFDGRFEGRVLEALA